MAQEVLNKNVENPEIGAAGETPAAPATSPTLNDDTKIIVKALVPAVYYTCSKTFDTFAWVEVGDTQEMTYLQLKLMKAKHPRYFTEKWLLPCDDEALNKLNLTSVYRNTLSRGDMKILYGSDVQAAEDLLSGLSDDALTELTQKVKNAVKNGKIVNIKIIRLLEKQLGVELMKLV